MAAGQGFKTFTTGEVLTAGDVNGYLMQGVLVFASAAARDAAITSPQEGQFAYLKDTNVTTYYTGSAWANLDTTGMTNPMTTTGDTIYSSSGSTPARLGIGSTGNVLTVAGGVPTWAAPASGGATITQIATGNCNSGTSVSITGLTTDYIEVYLKNLTWATGVSQIKITLNSNTSAVYDSNESTITLSNPGGFTNDISGTQLNIPSASVDRTNGVNIRFRLYNAASTTGFTTFDYRGSATDAVPNAISYASSGIFRSAAQITSIQIATVAAYAFNGTGTYTVYGG